MIVQDFCGWTTFLNIFLKLLSIVFVVLYLETTARNIYETVLLFFTQVNKKMSTKFSEKAAKSFYADNFNSTGKDVSEGIEIYKNIKLKFLDASFNVCKWKTNNHYLQNYLNEMENQFSPGFGIQANNKVKVLGKAWNTKSGLLFFSFENLIESFNNTIPIKRNILSLPYLDKFWRRENLAQLAQMAKIAELNSHQINFFFRCDKSNNFLAAPN